MKISKEIKTALLVIVSLILLYTGINYLMANPVLSNDRIFYVKYANVGGLVPATKVVINGFTVGKIQDIELQKSGVSLVTFTMDHDFEFSKNSTVELREDGFIGGKLLAIQVRRDGPLAVSGDTLRSTTQEGMMETLKNELVPLQNRIERLIVNADSLITSVNSILDDDTRVTIQSSIRNLNATAANFRNASATLNSMLASNEQKFNNTMTNVDKMSENFVKISDSLAQLEISKTVEDLQEAVAGIDNLIKGVERGDGSIGKLLKDDKLYDNLSGASLQMEQLLEDMKLNPKRYVHFSIFGKRPKPYEPPKEEEKNESEN